MANSQENSVRSITITHIRGRYPNGSRNYRQNRPFGRGTLGKE